MEEGALRGAKGSRAEPRVDASTSSWALRGLEPPTFAFKGENNLLVRALTCGDGVSMSTAAYLEVPPASRCPGPCLPCPHGFADSPEG
jgi:hypothetical protein